MVSGTLGASAWGWQLLKRRHTGLRSPGAWRARGAVSALRARVAVQRFRRPVIRTEVGRTLGALKEVHAMMDVSDGLAIDLHRLCDASQVGVRLVLDWVPAGAPDERLVLGGGEDYELLWTCPSSAVPKVQKALSAWRCRASVIGIIVPASGGRWMFRKGKWVALPRLGYEHF